MRPFPFLVTLVLVAGALTGCLDGEPQAASTSTDPWAGMGEHGKNGDHAWAERVLQHGGDHDHTDPLQHGNLTTPNFRVLGYDPLVTDHHGRSSGSYFCGDAVDAGERRYAFVHSFWSDVALVVIDVTDPLAPFKVGELVLPLTHVYDVAVTPDARFVVLATSPLDDGPDPAPEGAVPVFRNACTGEESPLRVAPGVQAGPEENAPFASGVVLVDVTNPADPVVQDYRPEPVLGAHSVFATEVDGTVLVLASVTNLAHHASYYQFFTITETPARALLHHESTYRPAPVDPEPPVMNGHVDGWIAKHPVTGDVLAYLADWDGGVVVLDVANPATPVEVSRWNSETIAGDDGGNLHGTWPLPGTWDGRHYTFVGQEVVSRPRDTPTGLVWVLDTTDPANPVKVGAWTLPVNVEWDETLLFSTHYFRVVDRTLFVAMYHGGVWAVDVSNVSAPVAVGAFVPDRVPPTPAGDALDRNSYDWAPTVLEVNAMPQGDLVVFDGASGVYTVAFDANHRFHVPEPWPV